MGFFSRKDTSDAKGARTGARPSVSSEAQARELRVRARRRLIGALALVLAAVIVVPMLFDPAIPEDEAETPVVVPSIVPPVADAPLIPDTTPPDSPVAGMVTEDLSPPPEPAAPDTPAAPAPPASPESPSPPPPAAAAAPESRPPSTARDTPKPAAPANDRTDDGSVALALLEGRQPASARAPAAQQKGSFVLQIAAYTTEQDARTRRDKLAEAGVTNAYVEPAQASGRATYRLRVGPFPTREAAQAAQARLRALGYDNGFISSK